jgi:hypothetical protein
MWHIPANTMVLSEVIPVDEATMVPSEVLPDDHPKWILIFEDNPYIVPDPYINPVLYLEMTREMREGHWKELLERFKKEVLEQFNAILDSIELIKRDLGSITVDEFINRIRCQTCPSVVSSIAGLTFWSTTLIILPSNATFLSWWKKILESVPSSSMFSRSKP